MYSLLKGEIFPTTQTQEKCREEREKKSHPPLFSLGFLWQNIHKIPSQMEDSVQFKTPKHSCFQLEYQGCTEVNNLVVSVGSQETCS